MNILDLPIEILAIITTADLETFLAALKAPGIAQVLCCEYIQNYAKNIFIKIIKDEWVTKYYLDGKLHRAGGPALIRKHYWISPVCSITRRYNSPNEYTDEEPICKNTYHIYYRNKPYLAYICGLEAYYIYGRLHNSTGPAKIFTSGFMEFWKNDNFIRCDFNTNGEKHA